MKEGGVTMQLRQSTIDTLKNCSSIHAPKGFHIRQHIKSFWVRRGAIGFLNIREITPQMVREIRTEIIEADRPND